MALLEQKILKSVEVVTTQNCINVCWENQILRDEEIISAVPHRCAYMQEQKEQFLSEVEGGQAYADILGW